MTTLMIKDLSLTEELSPEQLEKINGGMEAQYEKQQEPYANNHKLLASWPNWFDWSERMTATVY